MYGGVQCTAVSPVQPYNNGHSAGYFHCSTDCDMSSFGRLLVPMAYHPSDDGSDLIDEGIAKTSRRKWYFYLTSRTRVSSSRTTRLKTTDHEALTRKSILYTKLSIGFKRRKDKTASLCPECKSDVPISRNTTNLFVHRRSTLIS